MMTLRAATWVASPISALLYRLGVADHCGAIFDIKHVGDSRLRKTRLKHNQYAAAHFY